MGELEVTVRKGGVVIIPDELMEKLGISDGSKLVMKVEGNRIILEKPVEAVVPPAPMHLLYRPDITEDPVTGEKLNRNLDLEARLMTIPMFAKLAKRGFFLMSEKNRALAFGFRTVEDAVRYYLEKGAVKKEDLEKAGIRVIL